MYSVSFNSDPKWNCNLVSLGKEERKKILEEDGKVLSQDIYLSL
jgi:hypothetical protein